MFHMPIIQANVAHEIEQNEHNALHDDDSKVWYNHTCKLVANVMFVGVNVGS